MRSSVRKNLFVVRVAAVVLGALLACGTVLAQKPASTSTSSDPVAAIKAAQKKVDDEYARALMSPFSAVAVQYFDPGQTHRLGIGGAGAAFGTTPAMTDVMDITLESGAFWVSPVAGSKLPAVLAKTNEGGGVASSGMPLKTRTKVSTREVIGLGRYFVEFYAASDTGNARVFDPQAPARRSFTGLKWFAPNLALQVKATLVPNQTPDKVVVATVRGLKKDYYRVGVFHFAIDGKPLALTALAVTATPKAGDELFVAFRDATTGVETYDVGRYLFVPFAGSSSSYVLDFNAATNPLCNYSPHYNCPIPLKENKLSVPIRAGEMLYPRPH